MERTFGANSKVGRVANVRTVTPQGWHDEDDGRGQSS